MKYNKLVALIILGVFTINLSFAQGGFGLRFGIGGSTLMGNDAYELTGKAVSVIGIVFPIKFSDKFRLQPEIQIAQKGARTGSFYSYEDAGRFATNYVDIPLIFQ